MSQPTRWLSACGSVESAALVAPTPLFFTRLSAQDILEALAQDMNAYIAFIAFSLCFFP
jgi:hypothetical protein